MNGWMDRRMNGWMDGWMNEWMDGWMNGWKSELIDLCFLYWYLVCLLYSYKNDYNSVVLIY